MNTNAMKDIVGFHRDLAAWSELYILEEVSAGFARLSLCNAGVTPHAVTYLKACSDSEIQVLAKALPRRFYPAPFLELMGLSLNMLEQAALNKIHAYLGGKVIEDSCMDTPVFPRVFKSSEIKRKLMQKIPGAYADGGLLWIKETIGENVISTTVDLAKRDRSISYSQHLFGSGSKQINQRPICITSCCGFGSASWICRDEASLDLMCSAIYKYMDDFRAFVAERKTSCLDL